MGPSRNASSARGRSRAPKLLRVLQLLAAAILTLVCAGITTPGQGAASMAVAIGSASEASTARATIPPGSHSLSDGSSRPVANLEAIEVDLDDDDVDGDRHFSPFAHAVIALRSDRSPLESRRASRAVPKPDPSRFAIGHGFARGPPV